MPERKPGELATAIFTTAGRILTVIPELRAAGETDDLSIYEVAILAASRVVNEGDWAGADLREQARIAVVTTSAVKLVLGGMLGMDQVEIETVIARRRPNDPESS